MSATTDQIGGRLGPATFATTPIGHRALLTWLVDIGPVAAVAVEGTGSYGALARHLTVNDAMAAD